MDKHLVQISHMERWEQKIIITIIIIIINIIVVVVLTPGKGGFQPVCPYYVTSFSQNLFISFYLKFWTMIEILKQKKVAE